MKCKNQCESCLMPFSEDPLGDKREHPKYCSYCFKDGKFCYEGDDIKEFQKKVYEGIRKKGTNPILAWFFTFMIRFAPRWQKK